MRHIDEDAQKHLRKYLEEPKRQKVGSYRGVRTREKKRPVMTIIAQLRREDIGREEKGAWGEKG